jgi:hypothetical protein
MTNKGCRKPKRLSRQKAKKFEDAVDKWQSDLKIAATKEIIKSCISIGLAVAATVASCGAMAGTLVAAGSQVVSKAAEVKALWDKVKVVLKELEAIYKKLKPTLKALGEILKTVKQTVELLKNLDFKAPGQDLKRPGSGLDALNATAQWRYFDVQVEVLEDSLKPMNIPGTDNYYLALKDLVIRGQTFIQAQTEVISLGDELAVITLRLRQEKQARPALEKMVTHFGNDIQVLQMLKIAMFDRLLAIRALVYVDLHSYASA